MMRPPIPVVWFFAALSTGICHAQSHTAERSFDAYLGIYKLNSTDFISIAKFDLGDGEKRMLFTDFKSGTIRILSPAAGNSFTAGTGLMVNSPVEMRITFARNRRNVVTGLVWQERVFARKSATRVTRHSDEISFRNGDVELAGTLLTPDTKGPHQAVVLLHGSGALNRYSFGPFPDYFLSRGFAVLVYDKRGTGSSKGNLEKSTFNDLADDGRAAVQFLRRRPGIKPNRIGLCGTSQGGFLAALVASGNRDIAFMINLYGMYVPAWQQELYRAEAELRDQGVPGNEIADALTFLKLEFEVGRTGEGWEKVAAAKAEAKGKKWLENVPKFSSLDELERDWGLIYSYNPSLALERVRCPVLALFGTHDHSTPVPQTIENMQRALRKAGNASFTVKVFAKGNHSLLESWTGGNGEIPKLRRFVPGLFETMLRWLREKTSNRIGLVAVSA